MKRWFFVMLFVLPLFSAVSSAQGYVPNLGKITCQYNEVGKCSSFSAMYDWATKEMSRKLNCYPQRNGSCNVSDREYSIEVDVVDREVCQYTHYRIYATPANLPLPEGHLLIWWSIRHVELHCQGGHVCATIRPGGDW